MEVNSRLLMQGGHDCDYLQQIVIQLRTALKIRVNKLQYWTHTNKMRSNAM